MGVRCVWVAALFGVLVCPALAQDALVPMRAVSDVSSPVLGHVRLVLDDGWKTYGVEPGPVGVKPSIDVLDSDNLDSLFVSWPADKALASFGQSFRGYDHSVDIEVHVVPEDPSIPVVLTLGVFAASCAHLCVPMESTLVLDFPAEQG